MSSKVELGRTASTLLSEMWSQDAQLQARQQNLSYVPRHLVSAAERLWSSYSSYKILQTEYVHTHLKGNKEQEHVFQEVFIILFIKEDN